ncbi:amino acid adenylation domain-containing protein, partial [Immundisolibacter sp.]|uniref:non-ribosomal peptide synthetase n=1 Tax=Immundisolibacter sp. TaxID=1934948 RepID=UPI0035660992
DRKALPAPEGDLQRPYEAPQSDLERQLAAIWSQVLGIERIGRHDNFFDLGGHSLLAVRVIGQVRARHQVELSLRALFGEPTVAALAGLIAGAERARALPPLVPVPRDGPLPLSFAQQRLWFLDQMVVGNAAYNIPFAVRVTGDVDLTLLEQAVLQVMQRHEVLRTRVVTQAGEAFQVIDPPPQKLLTLVDLSHLSASEQEREVQARASAEAVRPFRLAAECLLRLTVLRLGEQQHVLLATLHHIISDGWSNLILMGEIAEIYAALNERRAPSLPELPVQYADYAQWQRAWLQGEVWEEQVGYWRRQLDGVPALELPLDRPRPAVQSFEGAVEQFSFDPQLWAEIKTLSRRQGVTLYTLLLAAFQVLLFRYSGQRDFAVGSPVAGRKLPQLEPLIGFFVNTLALRTQIEGEPSFQEFLIQVRDTVTGAFDHAELSFEALLEELKLARDLSLTPVFQVAFTFQQQMAAQLGFKAGSLSFEEVGFAAQAAKFDLTLAMVDTGDGLSGGFEYRRDLFDAETIRAMGEHLETLLQAIVADPNQSISRLPMLSSTQRHELLVERNATTTRVDDTPVHVQVARCATSFATRPAVVGPASSLSFGELTTVAGRIAGALHARGVGPGARVGVCLPRSPEMIAAWLGTLMVGAAYVPLDPALPASRLSFMADDAELALTITDTKTAGLLNEARCDCVAYAALLRAGAKPPSLVDDADALAYLIYTSGSTGEPKGVCLGHRGLANLVAWHRRRYVVEDGARAAQLASSGFDAATWDVWPYLSGGATVYVVDDQTRAQPEQLLDFLQRERITHAFLPTPLAEAVLRHGVLPAGLSLRHLLTGGDRLRQGIVAGLPFEVSNHYGPTECTVLATSATLTPGRVGPPPIGKPIFNTQVFVVDPLGQPVPIGVAGELHIGGVGLAHEYWRRPELTAAAFIANPFVREPGLATSERLYRSGDRVRWRRDGDLEFLGRIDAQVKVRGFRIELGEVETALNRLDQVAACAVLAKPNPQGVQQLVAYVVLSEAGALGGDDLRAVLAHTLPDYMIPVVWVYLSELPVTANGKIDRLGLAAREDAIAADAFLAPRTPTEQRLADIWAQELGLPEVGVNDNFFALGGHSLLAVRLIARVQREFSKQLPLASLFEAQSVSRLARLLDAEDAGAEWSPLVSLQDAGDALPVYCVHEITGQVFGYRALATALAGSRPVIGIQALGFENGQHPFTDLPSAAAYYLEHVRKRQPDGPYCLVGHSFGGLIAFEMACQLRAAGQEVAMLVLLDVFTPQIMRGLKSMDNADIVKFVLRDKLPMSARKFRKLSESEQRRLLMEQLGDYFSWPQIQRQIEVLRGFNDMLMTYRPVSTDMDMPVLLFAAAGGDNQGQKLDKAWRRLVGGTLQTHYMDTDHFGLLQADSVRVIADSIHQVSSQSEAVDET